MTKQSVLIVDDEPDIRELLDITLTRMGLDTFSAANLEGLMCKSLLSVDWQGHIYDCDFNQMLELPILASDSRLHLRDLLHSGGMSGRGIVTGEHCYGCTAGQGSSCGGAL